MTPEVVLEAIRSIRGAIHCDPCTIETNPTGAVRIFTVKQNGLLQTWGEKGELAYVNSPYKPSEIWQWTKECIFQHATTGVDSIQLAPSRTDREWYSLAMRHADVLGNWRGRLKFLHADGTVFKNQAPFPSVLFGYGVTLAEFRAAFEEHCDIIDLNASRASLNRKDPR